MNQRFSIIIPVYNTEQYLPECIESVINQTYKNLEIILVNDGSPGNAKEICQRYLTYDHRVKYIEQNNQGVAIARNNGIATASGNYIFCMDSDDTMESTFIEKVYNVFQKKHCDCVIIGKRFCKEPIELIGAIPTCAIAVTKRILDKYPGVRFQEHIQPCEDGLFTHKLLVLTDNISYCDSAVYHYRIHSASSEHNIDKNEMLNNIPQWLRILEEFYTQYNLWGTPKLHLLSFIYVEPYSRLHLMPFSISEQTFLFNIIHQFITRYGLQKLKIGQLFSYDFRIFIYSNSYFSYKCKSYVYSILKGIGRWLFSIRNEYEDENKIKVITFLGIKWRVNK